MIEKLWKKKNRNYEIFKDIIFCTVVLLFTVGCSEQKSFNSVEWKNWTETEITPSTRWLMRDDLLNNYDLKAYKKKQVLDLLGKPNSESANKYYYQLGYTGRGINTGTMVIIFKNDSVADIEISDG